MAVQIIFAIALVLANGFFVATEFALARLRRSQVDELEREGRPGAASVRHAVDRIDAYLAACQLGITLASLGLGAIGKPVFEDLFAGLLGDAASVAGFGLAALLAFTLITLLHVVVGELSPKSLAIARPATTALWVGPPMRAFYLVTRPLVDLFNGLGNLLLKPFGVPPAREAGHAPHTEDELRAIMLESRREGLIGRDDHELTENAFAFGDRRVRDVMTPRGAIAALAADDDLQGAIALAVETGHTRLPLGSAEAGLDAPAGMIHAKDLLSARARGDLTLVELARPLDVVAESELLSEVLRDLRRRRRHLALVADEHGTTTGLVTLEDMLEELVGEIEDEFDPEATTGVRREGRDLLVPGSLPLRLVARELAVSLEDPHEATIGGHVVEALGRVPEPGEVVDIDGCRVEVLDSDGPLVQSLRLRPAS